MNLTTEEANEIRQALLFSVPTNDNGATCRTNALAILQAAKDRPQDERITVHEFGRACGKTAMREAAKSAAPAKVDVDSVMEVFRKWEEFWNGRKSAGPARMTGNLRARLTKLFNA